MKVLRSINITIRRREHVPRIFELLIPVCSAVVGLVVCALIFLLQGIDPIYAYSEIYRYSLGGPIQVSNVIRVMIPLILCATGLILVFRAGVWNIGAEGQILIGAIVATGVALFVLQGNTNSALFIFSMITLGFIFGGLWALIPAILKAKLDVNEIITTLMMNYIAAYILQYLVYGPWKGKKTFGFPITDEIPPQAHFPLIPGTLIHIPTLILAICSIVFVFFVMTQTTLGYEIKVFGSNPDAAKYAGISKTKVILITMFISGGLAGVAGAGEIGGVHHRLIYNPWSISANYGFTAIIVAFLARLNPIGIIPAAFLMAILIVGTRALQITFNLPVGVINVFNGSILITMVSMEFFRHYRIVIRRSE